MKYFLFILFLSVAHATSNFDKTEFKLTETLDISKHKLVKKYMSHRPVEYYLRHPRLYQGIKWDYINTKSALKRFHGVTHTHSIILECSHQYTHCEKWVGPKLEAKFRVQHVKPMLGCSSDDEEPEEEPEEEPDTADPSILDNWRRVNEENCDADNFFNEEVRTATEEECKTVFDTYNDTIYDYESGFSNYFQPSGCYRDVFTIKFNSAVTNVTCGTNFLECLCICKFSNCTTPS